ncbi:MAG: NADP-dependent phosphogluconate dehydrogenase [Caldilineaceae bacterium]
MQRGIYQIGMVGLGVMGRNLVLNMADHGFAVVGYDRAEHQVTQLQKEAEQRPIAAVNRLEEFVAALSAPRAVMLLVPAGKPVDAVIHDLLPYLAPGDLLIDGGNSYYKDTTLRAKALAAKHIDYLGVGISGGEAGARHGPSIMPGGSHHAYQRVQPIFAAAAAQVNGEPCVAYLGPDAAGHYVKMVHNGIEYGLMQLLAESYDLMKRGLGLRDQEIQQVYSRWNETELNSYLLEITADIFQQKDATTGGWLIDEILDAARQKGTGKWTSQDAMDLGAPVPTIDVAVAMRNLSAYKEERVAAQSLLKGPTPTLQGDRATLIETLRNALYFGMITTYAQGMAQLQQASTAYDYDLNLAEVARIWRGGCIIRAALLEDIRTAYTAQPALPNLLLDPGFGQRLMEHQAALRTIVQTAAALGIAAPGFMTALAYFDGYRSAWLPANLIQAQRDYFGAHTYERVDEKGIFHTQWQQDLPGAEQTQ